MCTLTFVPGLPRGGYVLAHNRDERTSRGTALPPEVLQLGAQRVLAPRDSDAGGTWIGVDARGRCVAILNGDSEPAAPAPPDARSRGLLVLELLEDARFPVVRATLERRLAAGTLKFKPFKLAVVEPPEHSGLPGARASAGEAGPLARMQRLDFDGAALHVHEQAGAQCAVSSTYRSGEVAAARGAAFARLLASLPPETDLAAHGPEPLVALLRAHHASHDAAAPGRPAGASAGDAFSVCMHRDDARTVSRTLVIVGADEIRMEYTPGSPCQAAPPVVRTLPRAFG